VYLYPRTTTRGYLSVNAQKAESVGRTPLSFAETGSKNNFVDGGRVAEEFDFFHFLCIGQVTIALKCVLF